MYGSEMPGVNVLLGSNKSIAIYGALRKKKNLKAWPANKADHFCLNGI